MDHYSIINSEEEVNAGLKSALKTSKNSKKNKHIYFKEDVTSQLLSQKIVSYNCISTSNPAPKIGCKEINSFTISLSKNSKNSKKNNKIQEMSEIKKILEPINRNGSKNEDFDTFNDNTNTKKNKGKEAKEKKNKADKKHRNLEEDKSNQDNKKQISSQV